VFTARYALSPYIKQIRFVLKGLIVTATISVCASQEVVSKHLLITSVFGDYKFESLVWGIFYVTTWVAAHYRFLPSYLVSWLLSTEIRRNIAGVKFSFKRWPMVISGFHRDVDDICSIMGYYAASCRNCLPTFRDNVSVSSLRVKKSFVLFFLNLLTLEDGTDTLSPKRR
jgi:hypothetical protein